ncbi:hypothetical protein Tco_0304320 [Tanacetum coccineum]
MTAASARIAIQEMAEHSQKWQDGTSTRCKSTETSNGLAAIQAQLNNLGREIKKVNKKVYAAQVEKGSYEMKDLDAYSIGTTLLDDALPTKEKDPWSFTLPSIINNLCFNKALADLRAGVSVMPFSTYTKLGLGESLDPLYGDYIELNDLNEPLELRRNQVGDLEPTIVEGEVVDEPMMNIVKTRCDNELIDGLDEYPSYCDFDRKIHIDCAYNQIVENMDSYHDEEIGDIIVGRQFSRDACVKARRFDGMITIYKGNDSVTYQMA